MTLFLENILGVVQIYGIGTDHRVYWTVPNSGSWSYLTSDPGEWAPRIVIHGDTIYSIGGVGSVYEISIHGGSWTQIAPPDVIDLAVYSKLNFMLILTQPRTIIHAFLLFNFHRSMSASKFWMYC